MQIRGNLLSRSSYTFEIHTNNASFFHEATSIFKNQHIGITQFIILSHKRNGI